MALNGLIGAALAYVAVLFLIAFWADRRKGPRRWMGSSAVYTLSLSVYCTAWTFYGAVGYAARSGLEYLTIYLGPSLVMLGWWGLPRLLVKLAERHRITSIADLLSARFGKSPSIAVLVTLIALVGVTPYIALQLQSIAASFAAFSAEDISDQSIAFWTALGLAVFTILFGTRNLDASERHHGVVMAIAVEAVVKLAALLAVGIYVVWGVGGGLSGIARHLSQSPVATFEQAPLRWAGLTFLSGAAFLCLPRMFQVLVVENSAPRHLATAGWAFPLYVLLMSLFVVPIAVMGLQLTPEGSNPDLFVLTVPLIGGQEGLALFAFLGGFSSATSMVIVAALALSTMVSNHIVLPLWLRLSGEGAVLAGDVAHLVLLARRGAILAILGLGYGYYWQSASGAALSSIGLIAFVGVAQILPALVMGLLWRGATRVGALWGMGAGFAIWLWTLLLPSLGEAGLLSAQVLRDGPWGIGLLRPQALLGLSALDPLMHALFWSLFVNTALLAIVSLFTFPSPLERVQAADFVGVFDAGSQPQLWWTRTGEASDLRVMVQRLIGGAEAQRLFADEARNQGALGDLPEVTPEFATRLERALAGAVGAATAHAMLGQILRGAEVSVEDLMAVAGETAELLEARTRLEATAAQLRGANAKLQALSTQKDAFLSQISHELRTPMTSIRAFAGILADGGLSEAQAARYAGIIDDEARRLTRLLDDLLDLSVLEQGRKPSQIEEVSLEALLTRATQSLPLGKLRLRTEGMELNWRTDPDQLVRVLINLISNAVKYCAADLPVLHIRAQIGSEGLEIRFEDNGLGIAPEDADLIFEKFVRLSDTAQSGGAGLGLAICAEILRGLGGAIRYEKAALGGAAFVVTLPKL